MQELSVSEASVCSVDMEEMSLIEDDWEGVALLFTVPSTKHKEQSITMSVAVGNVLTPDIQVTFNPAPISQCSK